MASYIKNRSGKIVPQNSMLVTRHLGIIASRVLYWYRALPLHVKNAYDVEDMIGDVVLHVVKRSHHHNITRGKESTFVWHTADNKCKSIIQHWRTKQYSACETVELTPDLFRKVTGYESNQDQEVEYSEYVAPIPNPDSEQFCHSLNAVERVIERSSDQLLNLIDSIFAGTVDPQSIKPSKTHTNDIFEELKAVAGSQSATLDDFLRVYKYVRCG
jgi:hypothetical protein